VKGYLRALKAIGFEPYVVIDGGMPEEKLETIARREFDRMNRVRKIMAAVNLADGEKLFGRGNGIMPTMVVSVTLQVLREESVWHRVCWNEADVTVAELAVNLDGVVLSNDSDFFIYNIGKGFLSIDDLFIPRKLIYALTTDVTSSRQSHSHNQPTEQQQAEIFNVQGLFFKASSIAQALNLDMAIMPYFAVLNGNDYNERQQKVHAYLIKMAAERSDSQQNSMRMLAEYLASMAKKHLSVQELLETIAKEAELTEEESAEWVQMVKQMTAQYDIRPIDGDVDQALLKDALSKSTVTFDKLPADLQRQLMAFQKGEFPTELVSMLLHRRFWCTIRLSSLEAPCPYVYLRELRRVIFSMLEPLVNAINPLVDGTPSAPFIEHFRSGNEYTSVELKPLTEDELTAALGKYATKPLSVNQLMTVADPETRLRAFCGLTKIPDSVSSGRVPIPRELWPLIGMMSTLIASMYANGPSKNMSLTDFDIIAMILSALHGHFNMSPLRRPETRIAAHGASIATHFVLTLDHVWWLANLLELVDLQPVSSSGSNSASKKPFNGHEWIKFYEGGRFHYYWGRLMNNTPVQELIKNWRDSDLFFAVLDAVTEGYEDVIERVQFKKPKNKKDKKTEAKSGIPVNPFDLLSIE
jgi:hypothetical protein